MSLDEHAAPQGAQTTPAPEAQQGTSGLAIVGLVLAFIVAPLGFILSLIAIFKTGPGKKGGRGLAIAGLIISLLAIGGAVTAGIVIANSSIADPACAPAKAAVLASPTDGDPAKLQATADSLNAAVAKAKNDDVKAATQALADDYTQMVNAVKTGNAPAGLEAKVGADAEAFDKLCSVG